MNPNKMPAGDFSEKKLGPMNVSATNKLNSVDKRPDDPEDQKQKMESRSGMGAIERRISKHS